MTIGKISFVHMEMLCDVIHFI